MDPIPRPATGSTQTGPSDDVFVRDAVRKWVASLPPRMQRVYALLYVEGVSQREAAVRLGLTQPRISQIHQELLERGRADLAHLA